MINGRLILLLSLFGLAMGVATVFIIPSKIEPLFWLAVFVASAWIIARKAPGKLFLHGFLTSLVNSVWVTGAHIVFVDTYLARHLDEAEMLAKMPMPHSPRLMMLMTGPVVGVVSGLILGLFAVVAGRLVKK
jgi:hypothetical protein